MQRKCPSQFPTASESDVHFLPSFYLVYPQDKQKLQPDSVDKMMIPREVKSLVPTPKKPNWLLAELELK